LLETNPRINNIENVQNNRINNRPDPLEEKDKNNAKEIPPDYFSLIKIKELL